MNILYNKKNPFENEFKFHEYIRRRKIIFSQLLKMKQMRLFIIIIVIVDFYKKIWPLLEER